MRYTGGAKRGEGRYIHRGHATRKGYARMFFGNCNWLIKMRVRLALQHIYLLAPLGLEHDAKNSVLMSIARKIRHESRTTKSEPRMQMSQFA